ncbi:MAG: DUF4126 domain-containing protein [Vicinamibacterales bacterium]
MIPLRPDEILAMAVAVSFAAGLNVYAAAATLGLLAQADLVALPPALHVLESWWTIGISGLLFVVEFFADKVPVFDLVWNALQTFVRVPAAALLAWSASSSLPPAAQAIAALAGGGISLVAHGGKLALRGAVTPSPEPFSNIALSVGEDVAAIALTWVATQHPWIAATVTVLLLILIVLLMRWVLRALRKAFTGLRGRSAAPSS